jgi:hypothetical protein
MQFSSGKLSTFALRALALPPVFCKHDLNNKKELLTDVPVKAGQIPDSTGEIKKPPDLG